MNFLENKIAWRYLFSKKGHNAINIVSGISAAAVMVVTAAMICVLSVMNGFGALVERMFSEFDPVLMVVPAEGQMLRTDTMPIASYRFFIRARGHRGYLSPIGADSSHPVQRPSSASARIRCG